MKDGEQLVRKVQLSSTKIWTDKKCGIMSVLVPAVTVIYYVEGKLLMSEKPG